ncbi:MAG: glycosyltransferase family 4 protein [Pseudomonadota bacterium]|nr:glycosyltransferase family 4 protein [Pseudomonadota bacterium]
MDIRTVAVSAAVFLASLVLTGLYRRYAEARQILDIPNHRSSHSVPVPRGGGIVFAAISLAGATLLFLGDVLSPRLALAFLGAGGLIAAVGFVDDMGHVAWRVRLALQAAAALWGVLLLGGMPVLPLGSWIFPLSWAGVPVAVAAVIWMCNLYNFMDGIDGLAASEGLFAALTFSLLLAWQGYEGLALLAAILAASVAGFLYWNRAPARIFMGDAGATFLGMMFGLLLVVAVNARTLSAWACLIPLGVFVVDATVTLVRRALRRENLATAHRTHAFQRLADRWGHGKTTLSVGAVNVFWLLPLSLLAQTFPAWSLAITALALLPLLAVAFLLSAGKEDTRAPGKSNG